ncbi:hypothetical protein MTBPR1_140022 [Candidatus Terasakiella magnetica]|uniref:Uncharacterized protein n=1 Tax=Candidatus Terasakiella magnetica TaxID=1867952 RepID=A0A1C3RFB6_9PROT|nr:hypothetical protein [Candidatus Terasakiella magnetica]SCA55904.1 hypothetical protein MTBPR1_140022 [Candidatus Terasakiella magnetica]
MTTELTVKAVIKTIQKNTITQTFTISDEEFFKGWQSGEKTRIKNFVSLELGKVADLIAAGKNDIARNIAFAKALFLIGKVRSTWTRRKELDIHFTADLSDFFNDQFSLEIETKSKSRRYTLGQYSTFD